jgi:isoleucyl-tRNA synthetase
MDFKTEADEIRALGAILEERLPLSGPEAGQLVSRLWLGTGRSRSRIRRQEGSAAIDVGFRSACNHADKVARAFGLEPPAWTPAFAVIWTTTPWTLPANQALSVHPEFSYQLVDTARRC